jgi:hypothetical protein
MAGTVIPGVDLPVKGDQVVRRCLTIRGVHNYRPEHLAKALSFLTRSGHRYPYRKLVGQVFSLTEINAAISMAATERYVRVAVRPNP